MKKADPNVRIVVLTNYSNEPYIKAMMEIGVNGYLLKDSPPQDVIHALRMVFDGSTVFSSKVTAAIRKTYLNPQKDVRIASPDVVTKREIEVLELIAEGASNSEIAQNLHMSISTVQYHLKNIFNKLRVKSRAEAVIHAAREGLIVIDE
jgi:DNA-binding NarL/FixJ family response regulator